MFSINQLKAIQNGYWKLFEDTGNTKVFGAYRRTGNLIMERKAEMSKLYIPEL